MEWNIVVHAEEGYVEVVTKGVADSGSSLNMAKALGDTMQTHRINKAIIDHRNVDYIIGTTAGFNDRPKALPGSGPNLKIKIAEIIRPEHSGHFKFLKTVFDNLGFKLSSFLEKDQALAWLSAEE